MTGDGIRAKDVDSSTMRPISPTWRTIVSVQTVKVSGSLLISFRYFRLRRSAESWIGVSGFLISCAMRRATSAHAALRRSEEHTSELQSLMRISYAVFCLKQKTHQPCPQTNQHYYPE